MSNVAGKCEHWVFDDTNNNYRYYKEIKNKFNCEEHKQQLTYEDYLSRPTHKHTKYLAPSKALPKASMGDNPGYRFKVKTSKLKQGASYIKTKDDKGNEHKYLVTKKKIYEIKEPK